MKQYKIFLFASLLILSTTFSAIAQQLPQQTINRLYYTAKVWGFVKNFHLGVNGCNRNADSILIILIPRVIGSTSDSEFLTILDSVFTFAGAISNPPGSVPVLEDRQKRNFNIGWFKDPLLGQVIPTRLDSVYQGFRGDSNCYYGWNQTLSSPYDYISNETPYSPNIISKPEYRFLLFFRYWNIINYFYPYLYAMDRSWDSTLMDMIQPCMDVKKEIDFHLFFLKLQSKLNDEHCFTVSSLILNYFGVNYIPFEIAFIEGKSVVRKVFDKSIDVHVGDIILSIDGVEIQHLRDSLSIYAHGSNSGGFEKELNYFLRTSRAINATFVLDNGMGPRTITFRRSYNSTQYADSLISNSGPIWKMLPSNIGYVDMGRLMPAMVDSFYNDLKGTRALIFDLRNYPNGTVYNICNKIMPTSKEFAIFTYPQPYFPGTLSIQPGVFCGPSSDNVDWYKGDVLILVNEETLSQAEFTVMALQVHPFAKTIGSQSAGADGDIMDIPILSDLDLYFTSLGVYYPDWSETQRVGVKLDVQVAPTIAGMRAGRDEVLESAINSADEVTFRNTNSLTLCSFPNPCSALVHISYSIPEYSHVSIEAFNLIGTEVAHIVADDSQAGVNEIEWDTSHLSTGSYIIRLSANGKSVSRFVEVIGH